MKYSEYLRQLNLGVVIKHGEIVNDGGAKCIAKRSHLIDQYTGTVHSSDAMLGLRPVHTVDGNKLTMWFDTRIIRESSFGTYNAIGVQHANDAEIDLYATVVKKLRAMSADDADIDDGFATFGFVPYVTRPEADND